MAVVSFHFHGYQPGDLVRWVEPDPLKPQRFEERNSPVSLTIRDRKVRGRNWTDAVLHAYGAMEGAIEAIAGAASVDVEPATLAWLLAKDPSAYRQLLGAWETGTLGFVMTPPFHPILPHHHRLEREILFAMMTDFYAPLLRRQRGPVGLWLPETAYSRDVVHDFRSVARATAGTLGGIEDLAGRTHLLLDERQVRARNPETAWYRLAVDDGMSAAVRDRSLSDAFAFGGADPGAFIAAAKSRAADSLLIASDLESLLANADQGERLAAIVSGLRAAGLTVAAPTPSVPAPRADAIDFSSWSDYMEYAHDGHTSDTRWTGLRRFDGHVVARAHGGRPISQLWKHAFTLATEQVETVVRRTARDLFPGIEVDERRDILRRLAVAYGRHVFRDHYRHAGMSLTDTDFGRAAEGLAGGTVDVDVAATLARAYVTMLMGLRSDPRFWDNPDTRVTFQNVVCLAQSLVDVAALWDRVHNPERAIRTRALLQATLVEFEEVHRRAGYGALRGVEGWETTDEAWHRSLESEVPKRSVANVVRRASAFALDPSLRAPVGLRAAEPAVADVGHIAGEAHGDWENRAWCEHRPG